MAPAARPYHGDAALLATMHGKERAIGPVLSDRLGLQVIPQLPLDTDRFGTFSGEVARQGSQLDAARAKIEAAFALRPEVPVAIASEGAFGPHPELPFLPCGRELVLLVDRRSGYEVMGFDASAQTNYAQQVVTRLRDALDFAERAGFPSHGMLVVAVGDGLRDPGQGVVKDLTDHQQFAEAVRAMLARCGGASIETDMRAHRNPTRMAAIGRASEDLARRFLSRCPACAAPGFDVTERVTGLPCGLCGTPTARWRLEILQCAACGYRSERPVGEGDRADPRYCDRCNP